jgi:hypothetical protein
MTPRPVALAESGYPAAKAGMATAEPKSVAVNSVVANSVAANSVVGAPSRDDRPAAPAAAPEMSRSQAAEQRLRKNRPEEGLPLGGAGAPEAELSFGDFVDLINPLQHIPIVSTIYRAITGDEISGPAKILGGMLFGGPIGFIASVFDTIVAQTTGRDLGETVLAAFVDEELAPVVQVAEARDLAVIAAQGAASEDGAPPVSGRRDPFGLQRGTAAAIAVTPGAVAAPWPQAAPVVAVELISADALEPGNPRLVPNLASAELGFAERMLEALDKYQVLTTERYQNNSRAPQRLDLEL